MNTNSTLPALTGLFDGIPEDITRRVVARCRQLGLTQDGAAARAGMSPRYLGHLLDFGPGFDPGAMFRLAHVLGLSKEDLVEGRPDAPPGGPPAALHPRLLRLTEKECWERLGTHGVGRIALPGQPYPIVLPVNYTVDGRAIAYRTADFGVAATAAGSDVGFEVDRVDDASSSGWSVLIGGRAERVGDPAEDHRLDRLAATEPWAGGTRHLWIRIDPETVTGRVILPAGGGAEVERGEGGGS
ncbi:pyridoxamine 5'-phosphate oxidase family protein [Kitasatospora sp. NPDC085879]|uniref:helix-turn-helix domain-containing protein n=1 Tax=Kitasatospora sp. NPDC085879 TaxID=3154769 RepID=UPI003440F474